MSCLSWHAPNRTHLPQNQFHLISIICACIYRPRWLHSIGKEDAARAVLAKLHSSTGDIHSPLIDLEMEEICEKVAVDGPDSPFLSYYATSAFLTTKYCIERWWDFRPLFRTRPDRYRTGMILLIGVFGQLSGNGLITYFLPVLLRTAGITSQTKRLTLTFVNALTSFAGAIAASYTLIFWSEFWLTRFRALPLLIALGEGDFCWLALQCWWGVWWL